MFKQNMFEPANSKNNPPFWTIAIGFFFFFNIRWLQSGMTVILVCHDNSVVYKKLLNDKLRRHFRRLIFAEKY